MPTPPSSVRATPLSLTSPTNRVFCNLPASILSCTFACCGTQSLNSSRRVETPFSHSMPVTAGARSAREAPRMRVMVWHVITKAMSCSAANFVKVAIMSLMTAYRRPAAHFDWSVLFFARSSVLRGYALSIGVESESMTTRLELGWGKPVGGRTNKARRCASVGTARWWKRFRSASRVTSDGVSRGAASISWRRWGTKGAQAASTACQNRRCSGVVIVGWQYQSSRRAAPREAHWRQLARAATSSQHLEAHTPPSLSPAHTRRRRGGLGGSAGQAAYRAAQGRLAQSERRVH